MAQLCVLSMCATNKFSKATQDHTGCNPAGLQVMTTVTGAWNKTNAALVDSEAFPDKNDKVLNNL